jgi:hypothetical protein
LYEYAVVRFLPRVEREEFINVGIILYCQDQKFLQSAFHLDRGRISSFCRGTPIHELEEHLKAFEGICSGGAGCGPIGKMTLRERFLWLTAPRSTIIQVSPIHTGFCGSASEMLLHLLERLVK